MAASGKEGMSAPLGSPYDCATIGRVRCPLISLLLAVIPAVRCRKDPRSQGCDMLGEY